MTTIASTTPFVLYGRSSRLNGRGQGADHEFMAPNQQREKDISIARMHGLPYIEGEFMYDADRSGGTFVREEFDRALSMIKGGERAGMIVPYWSRFERTGPRESLAMVAEIEAAGGQLYDDTGLVTVQTAMGEAFTTMKSMFSRLEHRQKGEGLADAVERAILGGRHLVAPFGYVKVNGRLSIFEREAEVVYMIFERRGEGWSWSRIAEAANATGVYPRPRKRDGVLQEAHWTAQTVSQLTRNEVYIGVAFNGEHRTPGAHKPIILRELWAAVEEMRGTKPTRKDGRESERALLSGGLARCAGCGHALVRDGAYYRCRREKQRRGTCLAPATANAADLEEYVVGAFKDKALGTTFEANPKGETVELAQAELEEVVTEAQEVAARIKPGLTEAMRKVLDRRLAEVDRDIAIKTENLAKAKMAARGVRLPLELDAELFDRSAASDQRHWIGAVFESAIVRKSAVAKWREPVADRVTILRKGEAPVESTTALIPWITARSW